MNTKEQSIAPNQLISDIQLKLSNKSDKYDRKYKIACVGSEHYNNKTKIKEFLFGLNTKLGDDLLIISGGRKYGADKYIRKYSNEFGMLYLEFNPAHTTKNLYSAMGNWFYNKEFSIRHLYSRNKLMVDRCNSLVIFIADDTQISGELEQLIKSAQKKNIKIVIIS